MAKSKSDAIVELLVEGKSSREIIEMGYKKGTVYSTQPKWHQEKAKPIPNPKNTTVSK